MIRIATLLLACLLVRLRRGQAAFFLLLSPAPEGQIDFTGSDFTKVWLDGHKIERVT